MKLKRTLPVVDPSSNTTLGVIRLGNPSPNNFSPLYKGQVLVHGMGFSPDHRTIAVVSIGSNSVTFIDIATNVVKHITYVGRNAPTSVSLFDQGPIQVLEAAVSGLQPKRPYVLALAENPDGTGALQPLQSFMTNPAGAAIVNAIGPIRQLVESDVKTQRRYLAIVPASGTKLGAPVQVQVP